MSRFSPVERAELLAAVCPIARAASAVIMPFYHRGVVARTKHDRSPVSDADEMAEQVILAGLAGLTPDIPIIAEEEVAAGRVPDIGGGRFWLVDPLDGTKEFLKGVPEFTVNIALVEDRLPVLGVVLIPPTGALYAGAGPGSAIAENAAGERRPIAVRRLDPDAVVVALSRTYGDSVRLTTFLAHYKVAGQIKAGSSLKFCLLAAGEADIYPRYGGSSEWDIAAGHAVLVAAGGMVETTDGRPFLYGKPGFSNPDFIAWGGRA
ncbi:MAG: 3'(2'),5'-bisphosphate nucleotidase [Alphaproteobacteria bacterium]|nr:3'(2'),5'-bisphosphate nucleotidase [Alphaproteobacteria bacterium]